jgi:prephenate dehydrogenase/chorismate mutase
MPYINTQELQEFRQKIDILDQQLLSYLDQRAELVKKVGQWKKKNNYKIHDPNREKDILNKLTRLPRKHLRESEVQTLFQSLIEFYRTIEKAHSLISSSHLPQKCKVGFYGFGLMGASIGLALADSHPDWEFFLFDPYIEITSFQEWNSRVGHSRFDLVNEKQLVGLDFVFLAAPIDVNNRVGEHLSENNKFVLDLGSVLNTQPSVRGFHPLVGKEETKYTAAQANLFYGKVICLTNIDDLPADKIKILQMLVHSLGADYWVGTADEHNSKLAFSSHLVHLLAITFGQCLKDNEFESNVELIPKAAHDLLRLCGSDLKMWEPILTQNKDAVEGAIHKFQTVFSKIASDLNESHNVENKIEEIFSKSYEVYQNIFVKRRKL